MISPTHFFSPGKLLLTAEYFVLDGALALAVPTKLGQDMQVEKYLDAAGILSWQAYHQGKLWLNITLNLRDWQIINTNERNAAHFVQQLLEGIENRVPGIFEKGFSYKFTTNLQFPADYGLGSSSTLINNLAEWSGADAFELNHHFLKGSGYDIAVAQQKAPLLYRNKPEILVKKVDYTPAFKNEIIFIHLNKKQNSRHGIQLYHSKKKSDDLVEEFSALTEEFFAAKNVESLEAIIREHEEKLSHFLEIPTVQSQFFKDYNGAIKSLGAWGGDFILATKSDGWKDYFRSKNFPGIFEWDELIG